MNSALKAKAEQVHPDDTDGRQRNILMMTTIDLFLFSFTTAYSENGGVFFCDELSQNLLCKKLFFFSSKFLIY